MPDKIRQSDFYLIPNLLSVSRILCVPVIVVLLYLEKNLFSLIVFILVGLTDLIDGWLARRFNTESRLGMLLDPLADKLIVISTMIMLLWLGRLELVFESVRVETELVGPILVIVTVGRELSITALRALASTAGVVMAADRGGKIKTLIQFVAISILILGHPALMAAGQVLLIASVVAALWSGFSYFFRFVRRLPE